MVSPNKLPVSRLAAALLGAVAGLLFAIPVLSPRGARAQDASPGVAGSPAAGGSDLSAEEYAEMGEAAEIVRDLRPQKPKTVVLIFDVSGSMKGEKMLRRARQAAANVVRYAVSPGDRVDLFTFGATSELFQREIRDGDDKRAVLDKIPTDVGADAGTNIRRPHHEALKRIEAEPSRPAAIVVLTDSYNDQPRADAAFADYKRYYTPGGMLSKYPPTSENRDYERLLEKLVVSGRVKQYGVGIRFAPNGRPIERLPQAAPPPVEAPAAEPTPFAAAPPAPASKGGVSPLVWLAVAAAVVIGGILALLPRFKATPLRITGGPGGPKDFSVKGGQPVRIGGDGANFAADAYGLPNVKQPVATVKASGGRLTISPAGGGVAKSPAPAGASGGNPPAGVRVYHNGLLLEGDAPLAYGDEVRVSLPGEGGAGGKEYRLKFADPKQTF